MAERLGYSAASLAIFAAGSIGAFLIFAWPRLLHPIIIGYLMAALVYRGARVVLEFILSPPEFKGFGESSRFRILPVRDASATFWVKRLSYAVGWYAFGWVTISLMGILGFDIPTRQLLAYALGIVLLGIGIEAVWHRPEQRAAGEGRRLSSNAKNWLFTILFVLLWLLWVASAMRLFWLLAVIVGLPLVITAARRAVNNVFRPPGSEQGGKEVPSVIAASIERGVRAALVILAVVFLAQQVWHRSSVRSLPRTRSSRASCAVCSVLS